MLNRGAFMVPKLPYINGTFTEEPTLIENGDLYNEAKQFVWKTPLYFYDVPNGIVYVNKCNTSDRIINNDTTNFDNFFMPMPIELPFFIRPFTGAILYHASLFIFYPIFTYYNIMHAAYVDNKRFMSDFTTCAATKASDGGSISKSYITLNSTKKRYLVRLQNKSKYILLLKNKIFLSQIRGKYRYCA